jgi:hypothetical protein
MQRRKIKYCHQARNRPPFHECYQTGNKFWEEESIDRNGREWEIPEENCPECVEKGSKRYRDQEEQPEPVMEDPKGYYADGELEAVLALECLERTVGENGRVVRFSPLPHHKPLEQRHDQTVPQYMDRYRVLPVRARSIRRYDRPKRGCELDSSTNRTVTAFRSHITDEVMDLDKES